MKKVSDSRERPRALEKALGYRFRKKEVFLRALTHKSYGNENSLPPRSHNERLEFLGDAVLDLAVSQLLMERFPEYAEGNLSKLRAGIVNERTLATLARRLNLGSYLWLGRGEEQTGGREKDSLLADGLEALFGAVFLDRGYDKAARLIHRFYEEMLEASPVEEFYQDYKTELQERCQARFRSIPSYRLVEETGPDHEKVFEVELYVRDRLLGRGKGRNKKEAEQAAAREGLAELG